MLNLDTHILLHALKGSLKPKERQLLGSAEWSVSAIVPWEICKLRELGRIELDLERPEVTRIINAIHTWPLSWEVCKVSCGLDFGGDPADRLIAATSFVHNVPLVTRDRDLLRSRTVPLARV